MTFDLTSDQEKLPRNRRRKKFTGEKKRRNLQESNRGVSLSRMDRSNSYINTFNEYDIMCLCNMM